MREIGCRPAHAGFLYSRIHGPVGSFKNPEALGKETISLPSAFLRRNWGILLKTVSKIWSSAQKREEKISIFFNPIDKREGYRYNVEEK